MFFTFRSVPARSPCRRPGHANRAAIRTVPGKTVEDYIDEAGGYGLTADDGNTFVVLPDGSAHKV